MIPIYGVVELKNGLCIKWMRFVEDNPNAQSEAVRIVIAQHCHVDNCYVTPE